MLRLLNEMIGIALLVIILFSMAFSGACKKQEMQEIPYLSPEYYNCLEAVPSELVSAYFSNYGNMAHSESQLNKRYFVFKSQLVQDWTLKEMDQGWIWLEGNVKCVLVNISDMKYFKIGDKIDVVGYNMGSRTALLCLPVRFSYHRLEEASFRLVTSRNFVNTAICLG
jgi:hypothetical protein